MDDSRMAPLSSRKFSLIWWVSLASTGTMSLAGFPISPIIETESSLSPPRFMMVSSSLSSTLSPSHLTSQGLLSLLTSLSFNLWLASHSYLLIFYNSSIFLSSTSLDPPSFLNFSDYLATFLILSLHHFSTMVALFKAFSSLESISCCFPHIFQRTLPLSHAMTLTPSHPTPREGVYASILVEYIINIPSCINKYLIHKGISLNILPLATLLKISFAHKKYWWFSAANLIMYPFSMVLTQKSIACVTGQFNL